MTIFKEDCLFKYCLPKAKGVILKNIIQPRFIETALYIAA